MFEYSSGYIERVSSSTSDDEVRVEEGGDTIEILEPCTLEHHVPPPLVIIAPVSVEHTISPTSSSGHENGMDASVPTA